jgi:hypothetical protein
MCVEAVRPPGVAGQHCFGPRGERWGSERSSRGRSPVSPKGEPLRLVLFHCYLVVGLLFSFRCVLLRQTAFRGADR